MVSSGVVVSELSGRHTAYFNRPGSSVFACSLIACRSESTFHGQRIRFGFDLGRLNHQHTWSLTSLLVVASRAILTYVESAIVLGYCHTIVVSPESLERDMNWVCWDQLTWIATSMLGNLSLRHVFQPLPIAAANTVCFELAYCNIQSDIQKSRSRFSNADSNIEPSYQTNKDFICWRFEEHFNTCAVANFRTHANILRVICTWLERATEQCKCE